MNMTLIPNKICIAVHALAYVLLTTLFMPSPDNLYLECGLRVGAAQQERNARGHVTV